jgi:GT2 family glycosyltransferase
MPAATVVICTHDRAAILGRAVEAAMAQAVGLHAEVLVVDNASTDGTEALVRELQVRLGPRLRLTRETELGLSVARNRGLADATGEVAVFLDDDAVPRPGWLAAVIAPFRHRPVAGAGGRIVVAFPGGEPAWYRPELSPALSGFDLGSEPRRVRYGRAGDVYPYGANFAVRVSDALRVGGFSRAVGPLGRRPLVHDETDLCYRLEEAGGEIHYAPAAVVDHIVAPERITPAWFLWRYREGGRSAATFILRNRGLLRALWRIRWLYGPKLLARPYSPRDPVDPARFVRECQRREALGYLAGLAEGIGRYRSLRRDRAPRPARDRNPAAAD